MEKTYLLLLFAVIATVSKSQTNTFPANGNAGIGTLNPANSLEVVGNGTSTGRIITTDGANSITLGHWAGANRFETYGKDLYLGTYSNHKLLLGANNLYAAVINGNGNLGLGTGDPVGRLDVRGVGYFNNYAGQNYAAVAIGASGGGYGSVGFGYRYTSVSNEYQYAGNDYASQVVFESGGLKFRTAPQGITGNTVSFTDALTLLRNGSVGIGTMTPNSKLEIAGNIFTSSQDNYLQFGIDAATAPYVAGSANGNLYLGTNNTAKLVVSPTGFVGIGTDVPSEKLAVNGNIRAKKLIVTQTGWSDYVFEPTYALRPLSEVARFIKANKHLPDIPSAKEVARDGINVGDNQALLLKKIEELTLYIIKLEKRMATMERKMK